MLDSRYFNCNASCLSTKELIQAFRDDKWDDLLTNVISFCELRSIDVPDMTARYVDRRGLARHQ